VSGGGRWRALDGLTEYERRAKMFDKLAPPEGVAMPDRLLDAVAALTPGFEPPEHLAILADALERAPHGRLRIAIHAPPRWGKTELLLAAIAWTLRRRDPALRFMYAAHSAGLAHSKSARARMLAQRAGVQLDPATRSKGEWRTLKGGEMRAFGYDSGSAIGHGADVLISDDAFRGLTEASSAAARERVWQVFTSTLLPRLEPDGSAILCAQRLHEDDLTGRALRELGFEEIRVTPRDEEGHSRWPTRFPDEVLADIERERGPFLWSAQYEGRPTPREGRVFSDPVLIDTSEIPPDGDDVIGVDLAHTATHRSDPHALVAMRRVADVYYVLDARSRVCPLTAEERDGRRIAGFTSDMRAAQVRFPRARFAMYAGGNAEPLVLRLLSRLPEDERVRIECMRAVADKFLRSQGFAAAVRAGKVLVAKDAPWSDRFIAHLAQFTGERGGRDDITDAAVAAYDALAKRGGGGGGWVGGGTGQGSRARDQRHYAG
jgi:predicted phage terminase large subunit-like protein